ncbi:MAG TPA: hypothetical protein VIU81_06580 [Gaiellaceae bacterium]
MNERLSTTLAALVVLAGALFVTAAAAAPGKLDPGFGNGGVAVTATAPGAGEDGQNGLAIQRNGGVVVGGSSDMGAAAGGHQWRILRYTRKGDLDVSFGAGGTVLTSMSSAGGFDEHIWNIALDGDGRIVAAGDAVTATGGFDVALARFNADGTLDTSFGTAGKVTTAVGPGTRRDRAHDVAVLDDGKIVVAGFADMGLGAGGRNFMLARYNPDGSLDGTFGSGGIAITRVAPGDNNDIVTTNGLTIDPAGRIVVTGQANMGPGAGGFNSALARYLPSGALDRSFDGDGIVTAAVASADNFDTLVGAAITAGGKIVAAAAAEAEGFLFDLALLRYNPDGSLDASFGTGGKVTLNVGPGNTDDLPQDLVVQTTGKILVGGGVAATAVGVDGDFLVARFNAGGSLDASFGTGGIVRTSTAPGAADDEIFEVALQSDAKLIASGECEQPSTGRSVCVARYKVGEAD